MCPRVDGGGFAPSKSFSLSVCRSLYSSMGVCMIMLFGMASPLSSYCEAINLS